jgi:CTP:phosphocholine cytidylyltransferase-like protein
MIDNGVTTNFFHDANGNQIRKEKVLEKWYYTYDSENRLTRVEYFDGTQTIILGQYYYDGDGKRIKKVESSRTTNLFSINGIMMLQI